MAGYTRIDNDVLTQLLKLPGRTTDVYMALMAHRNQKTGLCNPSQEAISAECSLAIRSVRRSIKVLLDAGLLAVVPQVNRLGKASNQYMFPTGRGQERPLGRGQERPGLRTGEASPWIGQERPLNKDEVNKTKAVAYCNKQGHGWTDLGDTLRCRRCGQEQPNNVIELQA